MRVGSDRGLVRVVGDNSYQLVWTFKGAWPRKNADRKWVIITFVDSFVL
jgi:hypothetical protein